MCTPYIESQKNGCRGSVPFIGAGYRQYLSADFSNPLHNQLPSRYRSQLHRKPVNSNFGPKTGCHDKLVAMAKSLSTSGPYLTHDFYGPSEPHSPNGISICSAVFAQMTAECRYSLQWDAPFPTKFASSRGGSGPRLMHGSLGPPESSTQTTSPSGSLV